MPVGLIDVAADQIVVPKDGYGAVFSAFAPKGWAGVLPTRPTPTPYRLQLCVDAPAVLFMRPGRERYDYEFCNVWRPIDAALRADLARARLLALEFGLSPEQGDAASLPDITLNQLERRKAAIHKELGPWIAAAENALAASRGALEALGRSRVEVAEDGEVVYEANLPLPWVAYPKGWGTFVAYGPTPEGPFVLCECSRVALDLYNDLHDPEHWCDGVNPPRIALPAAVRSAGSVEAVLRGDEFWSEETCHRCVGVTPSRRWASGAKSFREFHGWWIQQALMLAGVPGALNAGATLKPRERERAKDAENGVRLAFGHHRIGEGLVRETLLASIVSQCLPGRRIERRVRHAWMEHLEFDIWVPSLKLAIEYQGEQHYQPIAAWGGVPALEALRERDARKEVLAAAAGVVLLHVRYDEALTVEHIRSRLHEAGLATS